MATLTTEQVLRGNKFAVADGRGRVKDVEGTPVAASSDETVARVGELSKNDDLSWSFDVDSVAPGTCRVSVDADADLGEGVQDVVAVLDIEVTLDERTGARVGSLEPGKAEDRPA